MGPGHRIRQRRKELDLTQMECASRIGIAQASLSEIETGETRSLRGTTLVGLARVLKTTTRWLMTGKGPHEADAALSEQEEALLGIFTQLSQQNRAAILAAMQAMFRSQAQDNEDGK
jgi:transcriptional regulator with XRE-family HTH domain